MAKVKDVAKFVAKLGTLAAKHEKANKTLLAGHTTHTNDLRHRM